MNWTTYLELLKSVHKPKNVLHLWSKIGGTINLLSTHEFEEYILAEDYLLRNGYIFKSIELVCQEDSKVVQGSYHVYAHKIDKVLFATI